VALPLNIYNAENFIREKHSSLFGGNEKKFYEIGSWKMSTKSISGGGLACWHCYQTFFVSSLKTS